MKVVYLHGLESTSRPSNPKIKWLNSNFDEVYAPQIDYKKEKTFKELLSKIKSMNPDLIVGSSMGGYFSYIIGSTLKIKTCLFNPAVHSRSMEPEVDDSNKKGNQNNVYLGDKDRVIPGEGVKKYFASHGNGSFKYNTYKGGHRVPYNVFTASISEVAGIKESVHIMLYEEYTQNKLNQNR